MMHLVKAGKLTLQDIEEAEAHIRELQKKSGKP
jgi:hypothetical protein